MIAGVAIGELVVKWLIPFICAGIIGLLTAQLVKPWKKGTEQTEQEKWEVHAGRSPIQKDISCCKQKLQEIENETKHADDKILLKLNNIETSMETINIKLEKQEEEMDNVRQGVLDAHLQNLIETCKGYIEKGWCTPLEFDHYNTRLEVYHRLGGNGHMDNWNQLMQKLPKWNEEEYKQHKGLLTPDERNTDEHI